MAGLIQFQYDPEAVKGMNARAGRYHLMILLAGALPCLGLSVHAWGTRILLLLLAALIPGLIAEFLFARTGRRAFRGSAAVVALLLVLMVPPTTPLWMVCVAAVFGIFFGQEIFGGAGYHLVSPVLLAKLFLMIGFLPHIQGPFFASPAGPEGSRLWIMAGLLMLPPLLAQLAVSRSALSTLAGAMLGTGMAIAGMHLMEIMPQASIGRTLVFDSFAFVTCFLLLDPACSPASRWARMIYGFTVTLLAFAIGAFSDKYAEGIVIALLFGNLISPLLDQLFLSSKREPS